MRARSKFGLALLLALVLAAPVGAVWSKFVGAVQATLITNSGTLSQTGVATFSGLIRAAGGVAVSSGSYVTVTSGTFTMDGTPLGVVMNQSKVMTSAANTGKIYFSTSNVFMVTENGGAPRPIVDPPGMWTCTLRMGAGCSASALCTDSVACVGLEKAISGGCAISAVSAPSGASLLTDGPTGQGWQCEGYVGGGSFTVKARVNCCL